MWGDNRLGDTAQAPFGLFLGEADTTEPVGDAVQSLKKQGRSLVIRRALIVNVFRVVADACEVQTLLEKQR